MIDQYEREERIALRMDSGMSEREAVAMTDAENQSKSMFKRVAEMAKHQRDNAAPKPLTIPKLGALPEVDRKRAAAHDD